MLVLLEQGVVERQDGPAGIAEDHVHALIDQRLDHHLRARQGCASVVVAVCVVAAVMDRLLGRRRPFCV